MDEKIREAQIEAEKRLENLISKDELRYNFYLTQEMKKILKEQGIEWDFQVETDSLFED